MCPSARLYLFYSYQFKALWTIRPEQTTGIFLSIENQRPLHSIHVACFYLTLLLTQGQKTYDYILLIQDALKTLEIVMLH